MRSKGAVGILLILILIPTFAYAIYPAIDKVFPLTPIRKISIGLFIMVLGFGIVALVPAVGHTTAG